MGDRGTYVFLRETMKIRSWRHKLTSEADIKENVYIPIRCHQTSVRPAECEADPGHCCTGSHSICWAWFCVPCSEHHRALLCHWDCWWRDSSGRRVFLVPVSEASEKAMTTHSSTLAWEIPWTEEPGRLQSMGLQSQTWLSSFAFTFHFHALEKEMATHSSILAWRIPGTGEPGGLPSMGSHRVGHDWRDLAAAAAVRFSYFPLNLITNISVLMTVGRMSNMDPRADVQPVYLHTENLGSKASSSNLWHSYVFYLMGQVQKLELDGWRAEHLVKWLESGNVPCPKIAIHPIMWLIPHGPRYAFWG